MELGRSRRRTASRSSIGQEAYPWHPKTTPNSNRQPLRRHQRLRRTHRRPLLVRRLRQCRNSGADAIPSPASLRARSRATETSNALISAAPVGSPAWLKLSRRRAQNGLRAVGHVPLGAVVHALPSKRRGSVQRQPYRPAASSATGTRTSTTCQAVGRTTTWLSGIGCTSAPRLKRRRRGSGRRGTAADSHHSLWLV